MTHKTEREVPEGSVERTVSYVEIPKGVRPPEMTDDFRRLSVYNAEVARGIVHTPECDEEMRQLQAKWDEWWKPYVR